MLPSGDDRERESEWEISSALVKLPSRWIQVRCLPCRRSGSSRGRRRRQRACADRTRQTPLSFRRVHRPTEAREKVKGALARNPGSLFFAMIVSFPGEEVLKKVRACARALLRYNGVINRICSSGHSLGQLPGYKQGRNAGSLYIPPSLSLHQKNSKNQQDQNTLQRQNTFITR